MAAAPAVLRPPGRQPAPLPPGRAELAILSACVAPYGTAALARVMAGKYDGNLSADMASTLSLRIESLLTDKQAPPMGTEDVAARIFEKHQTEPKINVRNQDGIRRPS
jgi:hypothetical protein